MALIKHVDELTTDDLEMFPLWEVAADVPAGVDQTAVRPVDSAVVPVDADDVVYHVACDVELGTGRRLTGRACVLNGELFPEPPIVVDGAGNAYFLDAPPAPSQRTAFEAMFGVSFEGLFPVRWQLRLPLEGEPAYRAGEMTLDFDEGPAPGQRLH